MKAIYKKELNVLFKTSIGYVFISIYLLLGGVYFYIINLVGQSGDIKVLISSLSSVLIFLIPILTMRSFAEEKRRNTDELLLTASISSLDIILGKFASMLTVFLIPTVITLLYPLTLATFGAIDVMSTLGNYLGLILLASSFIAIGMFISSLTDSQVIAAVVSYAFLLISYMAATAGSLFSPFLYAWLRFLSLTAHFESFSYGVLSLTNIVYYLSVTALFLFLNLLELEHKRMV